ncbi:MAG: hypothetical protein MI802_14630 [Desulfobacterales bacterium]|nr:hypothetical protein [Desulfobacterales bacterium]
MEDRIEDQFIDALAVELAALKLNCLPKPDNFSQTEIEFGDKEHLYRIAGQTAELTAYLTQAPYTPARVVAGKLGMDRDRIILAYKLIQRTGAAADLIRSSPNGDYLNIVRHYFDNRMYVVVFFTGLACPGRCRFCPNVIVGRDGTRKLVRYPGGRSGRMSAGHIDAVFQDISLISGDGSTGEDTSVLVKISGGLEPLTDTDTMALILEQAEKLGIRVKLFTNGILLNTPERRRLALKAGDVRISLSMVDEAAYGDLMFGRDASRQSRYGLPFLLDNLKQLVWERDRLGLDTRIGINTVVLEENHKRLRDFIGLAEDLGLDYVDFKPNYFSRYRKETQAAISEQVDQIKRDRNGNGTGVYFAGSLSGDNLFWRHREGQCHPHKQSRFKMFITPQGHCSPVHHGAFPGNGEADAQSFTVGRISRECSLLDMIGNAPDLPGLGYDRLNPFEHMLALEIEREEQDRAWGIPVDCNPYHFSKGDVLPGEIKASPLLH